MRIKPFVLLAGTLFFAATPLLGFAEQGEASRLYSSEALTSGNEAAPGVANDSFRPRSGVALRLGSTGVGLEVARDVFPKVAVRGGFGMLPGQNLEFVLEDESVDIGFEASVAMQTFHLMVDYAPFGPLARLSAGVIYNTLAIEASGTPETSYSFGARTFSPAQVGSVSADLEYGRKVAPYVGVGFGSLTSGRRVGVTLDAGIAFSGPMAIEFGATEMLSPMSEQQELIQNALDGVKIFPAVSLGFAIRL